MNTNSGEIKHIKDFDSSPNPSFLEFNHSQNQVYAVSELDNFEGKYSGAVQSFKFDPTNLTLIKNAELS